MQLTCPYLSWVFTPNKLYEKKKKQKNIGAMFPEETEGHMQNSGKSEPNQTKKTS